MAKTPAKTASDKVAEKKTPAKKAKSSVDIEKISTTILEKLKALNIEPQLQAELEWCIGSFKHDGNPVGLFEMAKKALDVFKAEQAKKTKGVTAKLISDIEKAVNA